MPASYPTLTIATKPLNRLSGYATLTPMLPALTLGIGLSLANLIIHCTSLLGLRHILTHPRIRRLTYPHLIHLSLLMATTCSLLMLAHFAEIAVWSLAFWHLNLAESWHSAFYDAFLSYTSLGFTMPAHQPWRLLEPISTLNGILMAGLSTAIMFQVLLTITAPQKA